MAEPDYSSPEIVEQQRQALLRLSKDLPFFNLLGIQIIDVEPGRARLALAWRPDLCQPAGVLHGGAVASLVDTAIAHAILLTPEFLRAKASGESLVSVDLRIKYLRPVSSGQIVCEAHVTRLGRQIIHAAAVVTNAEGKEVAHGDSIYTIVSGRQLQQNDNS
jgi:uncharacterized protein (TIGR00369 family)